MTQTPQTGAPLLKERDIDPEAYHIVKTLQQRGFVTYLVGGCVRDLLLDKHPKDFDIVTSARPQDVRKAISHAFIIGRRFRLVLVKRGSSQYEVSTFRRDPKPDEVEPNPDEGKDDSIAGDNFFGTPEEDACRRDFTINALFYDPIAHQLIDYAEGMADLELGMVRMIGDPNVRLLEDPIRIMRAIRLSHMIRFSIDPELRLAIQRHAESLPSTALPRRREEFLKYLRLENPALPFLTSADLGVLKYISPQLNEILCDTSRHDLFVRYLTHFHSQKLDSPLELFAGLVMAYFLTARDGVFPEDLRTHDLLDDSHALKLMRDELGMFKSEQATIAKAMHLMTLLRRRGDFESRGERRRRALIANEAFPLSLKLAEREHWLSATDLHFWQKQLREYLASGQTHDRRPKRPRRRRPRSQRKPQEIKPSN